MRLEILCDVSMCMHARPHVEMGGWFTDIRHATSIIPKDHKTQDSIASAVVKSMMGKQSTLSYALV